MLEAKAHSAHHIFGNGFEAAAAGAPLPTDALRVLGKPGCGPRGDELAAYAALPGSAAQELAAWVDAQPDPAVLDDCDCDARSAARGCSTLGRSLAQLHADRVRGAQNAGQARSL